MAKPLTHIKVPLVESDYKNRDESEAQLDCMSNKCLWRTLTRHYAQPIVKQFLVQYFSEMTADSYISDDLVVLTVGQFLLSVTREVQPVKG
jgi:hypothetical protein